VTAGTPSSEVLIRIQDTPNPNAWKFVLDRPVLLEGKASYSTPEEAFGNRLALDLLSLPGVKQVHFFENVITLTARFDVEPEDLQSNAVAVIQTRLPVHDPAFGVQESKKASREGLSPELQAIEEILDRTIRPGLQGDGGDIEIVAYENNQLQVLYQGACGTCPSSTTGTLMAIEGILRDEFNPTIEVIPMN
jgi:Fe-S cluster biogenesis protein NfuA